ncbi:MAG: hypothetical protein ACP5NW_00910 [Candidatus Woesearchaeota archaeon]
MYQGVIYNEHQSIIGATVVTALFAGASVFLGASTYNEYKKTKSLDEEINRIKNTEAYKNTPIRKPTV